MMPRRMGKRWVAWPYAVALLVGLLKCGGHEDPAGRSPRMLRVPLPRDIVTLDPAQGEDINTYNVIRQIYEGLVDYDPRTLKVVPRIARSWTVSPDGLTWTFELNPAVRFVDDP